MQEFFIRQGANYPALRMELIEDGRYDFHKAKINNALQDSDVVFTPFCVGIFYDRLRL